MTLEEVLKHPAPYSDKAWIYLPRVGRWNLETTVAILESEEILEEEEDQPEAGPSDHGYSGFSRQFKASASSADVSGVAVSFHVLLR